MRKASTRAATTTCLPRTSVRDLIVHGDDLAIATHGRGFWILDNMTPLRTRALGVVQAFRPAQAGLKPRTTSATSFSPALLYKPQIAYRLRRDNWTDTPLAAKGMHRFVWDLRYPAPGAVQRDFPISAISGDTPREPLGVLAVPGAYIVTLTIGGKTSAHPLTLKMDPRAKITLLGLTRQFTLATKIADMMNRSEAVIRRQSSGGSQQAAVIRRQAAVTSQQAAVSSRQSQISSH